MPSGQKTSPAHERVFVGFLEKLGSKEFRRQDLAQALYSHTSPRSLDTAKRLADVFIRRLANTGRLVKAGHVHWRVVMATSRQLKSGRVVPELPGLAHLSLDTHCPEKWAAVDLETGDVWVGSEKGWKRATGSVVAEAATIVGSSKTST